MFNTWEPQANLSACQEKLRAFETGRRTRKDNRRNERGSKKSIVLVHSIPEAQRILSPPTERLSVSDRDLDEAAQNFVRKDCRYTDFCDINYCTSSHLLLNIIRAPW